MQTLSYYSSGSNARWCRFKNSFLLAAISVGLAVHVPLRAQPVTKPTPIGKYATDLPTLTKGEQLFQANCSACHNFRQKGIGPNLAGVTTEVTSDWLRNFIRNAPAVIARKDARALQLFEEYKQYMPAFTALKPTEIDALTAFIHQQSKQASAAAVSVSDLGEPIKDPIPAKIQKSGLRLRLEEVTTAPASASATPLARITKTLVLPGPKDRLFIVDHRGKLYEMDGPILQPYMDMANERPGFINAPGLATGFGSFAFHPDFYQNGLLYTSHTERARSAPADFAYADSIKVTLQWVVTEWKAADPTAAVFSGTGRELMRVNMVSSIHGMQELTFNPLAKKGSPDYGLLYIGIGDGGASENGFYFVCNDNRKIWSSVLRIDPLGRNSKNGQYGIPADNPYARDNDPATLGEVYCRGFRNPNRICWSPDGKMLISDIGQTNAEELNIGLAGADYGWPEREGMYRINYRGKMDKTYNLPPDDARFRYTYPVALYDHDEGNAISGGFVYSGNAAPLLQGKYVFGDIVNGRVFCVDNSALKIGRQALVQELELEIAGKPTSFREVMGGKKTDFRIGLGLNQELLFFTKTDGKIYRVAGCSRLN